MFNRWFSPEDAKPKEKPPAPAPEANTVLRWFAPESFAPEFREIAELFNALAFLLAGKLPKDPETSVCLHKLLESRDAGMRARAAGLEAEAIKEEKK